MRQPHPDNGVAFLVVDDARFTCEMIRRTLRERGYHDVRTATTASEALEQLAERPADIVLADWLMPGMDGLALTRRIRGEDEEHNRYTYILLLTAREGLDSLTEAFDQGVDDFIHKSPDHQELVARVSAATRIVALQNDLLQANRRLLDFNRQLSERDGIDIASGLGNRAFVEQRLDALVRHVEGRGGTGLCGLVQVVDLPGQRARHGDAAMEAVIAALAQRLQHTVRPLDILGRISDDTFAVLMLHHGREAPHPNIFRRVLNALNLRAYKTPAGFLTVPAAMAITAFTTPWRQAPEPADLLETTGAELPSARAAGQAVVRRWREGN